MSKTINIKVEYVPSEDRFVKFPEFARLFWRAF